MKKIGWLLLVVCVLATATASAELIGSITIGMTQAQVDAVLAGEGIVPDYESEQSTHAVSGNVSVNVEYQNGVADWVNETVEIGGTAAVDLTAPDWSLTFDEMLQQLREGGVGYDMYLSSDSNSLFFRAQVFDTEAGVFTGYDQAGKLAFVKVELYDFESPLEWAARMTNILGMPRDPQKAVEIDNGPSHAVDCALVWEANGNDYSLMHHLMSYSFAAEDGARAVFESRIEIDIVPAVPDAEKHMN